MRDIIDKLTLIESKGLANRKPGTIFRDTQGNEITFNNVQFFPEQGGKFEPQELEKLLTNLQTEYQNIQWENDKTSKTGGIGLASFDSPEGPVYFGRFYEKIKSNFLDNNFPNQVGNYKLTSKSAEKMQSGLTPQDLLKKKLNYLTADEILEQLADSLGADNPLYMVAYEVAKGGKFPIKFPAPEGVSFSAFRDYFGEILQPIALQQGKYKGDADEAAKLYLNGTFADTLISFDFAKNAGLSDSTMTTEDGKMVKISSKGGKGATASAKNLANSIDELAKTPAGLKLKDKYKDAIEIIQEITRQGQANSPLYLAVKYDIIDNEEANQVRNLKNEKPIDWYDIDSLDISDNLKKLAKSKQPKITVKVSMYYHLLAVIAQKAVAAVNEKTDFSKAAADILNNGSLIQVYTIASQSKNEWTLELFKTWYPGTSIKGIYLSSEKTHYSTGINGNLTFKIDRGEGAPNEESEEPEDSGKVRREPKAPTEKEQAKKAKDIALGKIKPFKKEKPAQTNVGREKR